MKTKVDELIKKLDNNKDVVILSRYNSDNVGFDYFHHIIGRYKEYYFAIYLFKSKEYDPKNEISERVTDNLQEFKEFLETLTDLKFTLE